MRISSSLTDTEKEEILKSFYEYFNRENTSETGHAFEKFVREYLSKMGLDEVVVTQRTRDGGVDLKAVRRGIGDFSDSDITNYYIQARRTDPSYSIGASKIRELKGAFQSGKGIFITTSKFTGPAVNESLNDSLRPVVLIDGNQLIMSCIDREIGFVYRPIFSKNALDSFMQSTINTLTNEVVNIIPPNLDYVEKTITANDIRARIVSIPSKIINQIDENTTAMTVCVNTTDTYQFSICRGRNYFGGVTEFLRRYGLLTDDGVACPQNAKWIYDLANNVVNLFIEI